MYIIYDIPQLSSEQFKKMLHENKYRNCIKFVKDKIINEYPIFSITFKNKPETHYRLCKHLKEIRKWYTAFYYIPSRYNIIINKNKVELKPKPNTNVPYLKAIQNSDKKYTLYINDKIIHDDLRCYDVYDYFIHTLKLIDKLDEHIVNLI